MANTSRLDYLATRQQIDDLIARHRANEPQPRDYEPFAQPVRAAKTDKIYLAHTYHTKVPPAGIAEFIRHYTQPGDIVLDPFAGSGMTGVAAVRTGRDAILVDLAPSACHIAYNHVTPCDAEAARDAWQKIRERIGPEIRRLYATTDPNGKPATFTSLVWSDVFACADCGGEIVLWDVAARPSGSVLPEFTCPACGRRWKKTDLELTDTRPVSKRIGRESLPATEADIAAAKKFATAEIPCWYPDNRMMNAPDGVEIWGDKWRKGCFPIQRVADVYTPRNLWALATIWNEIGKIADQRTRAILQFLFTSIARRDSRRTAWNGSAGSSLSGTLYISSISVENNILELMNRRLPRLLRALETLKPQPGATALVYNGSATNLPLPDESIDYVFTDPPFGGSLQYAELNFFWESWLGVFTNTRNEAIMAKTQNKSVPEYEKLMRKSFREIRRVLKPGRWASVAFHSTSDAVWQAIQRAAIDAGFELVKAVPFDKVQKTYNQAKKSKAAGFDVVMNLHKGTAPRATLQRRTGEIDAIIAEAIRTHISGNPAAPRTAQYFHSLAISTLLNRGITVEKITIPYIIEICRTIGEQLTDAP